MHKLGMKCMHEAQPQHLLTETRLKLSIYTSTANDHTLILHLESDKRIDQSVTSLPFLSACLQHPASITGSQAFLVSHEWLVWKDAYGTWYRQRWMHLHVEVLLLSLLSGCNDWRLHTAHALCISSWLHWLANRCRHYWHALSNVRLMCTPAGQSFAGCRSGKLRELWSQEGSGTRCSAQQYYIKITRWPQITCW